MRKAQPLHACVLLPLLISGVARYAAGAAAPASGTPAKVDPPALFILGSSLSDTGNLYRRTFGTVPTSLHGYWHGRFSDGPAWPDYLQDMGANSTGLEIFNFAVGGATACPSQAGTAAGLVSVPDLTEQYAQLMRKARSLEGSRPALALIAIGVNDLYAAFDAATARSTSNYTAAVRPAAQSLVACIADVTNQLVSLGRFSKVMVANMYPLDLFIPWLQYATSGLSPDQACDLARAVNASVSLVNAGIASGVSGLNSASAKTSIEVWDLYTLLTSLLTRASQLGFGSATQACLQTVPAAAPYLPTSVVTHMCSQASGWAPEAIRTFSQDDSLGTAPPPVFWDLQHFTTGAHKQIARDLVGRL